MLHSDERSGVERMRARGGYETRDENPGRNRGAEPLERQGEQEKPAGEPQAETEGRRRARGAKPKDWQQRRASARSTWSGQDLFMVGLNTSEAGTRRGRCQPQGGVMVEVKWLQRDEDNIKPGGLVGRKGSAWQERGQRGGILLHVKPGGPRAPLTSPHNLWCSHSECRKCHALNTLCQCNSMPLLKTVLNYM